MRLRSGDKHPWENLRIEKHKSVRWAERTPSWFVLFDLQIFSGGVYPPSATRAHAQSLFLFPIVFQLFLVLIWFCFSIRRRTAAAGNLIVFFFFFFFAASIPCHAIWQRDFYEECELFRRVQRFWQRKVWTQRRSRGEKLRCKVLARKSAKLFANIKVQVFGKEKCKTHRQF